MADDKQIAAENLLKARRTKYGIAADCEVKVDGNIAVITIDNPLPDNDRIILEMDKAKLISIGANAMGAFLGGMAKPTFFDGK